MNTYVYTMSHWKNYRNVSDHTQGTNSRQNAVSLFVSSGSLKMWENIQVHCIYALQQVYSRWHDGHSLDETKYNQHYNVSILIALSQMLDLLLEAVILFIYCIWINKI